MFSGIGVFSDSCRVVKHGAKKVFRGQKVNYIKKEGLKKLSIHNNIFLWLKGSFQFFSQLKVNSAQK